MVVVKRIEIFLYLIRIYLATNFKFLLVFNLYLCTKLSFLKEKSGFNIDAAKMLIEKEYNYAPSVHCSYYGVFQMISHTLNRIGITFEQVAQEISKSKGRPMAKDSHTYPIDLIHDALKGKHDKYYAKGVRDKILLLRKFRTISDYKNEKVGKDQSIEAFKISNEIITILNTKL